MRERILSPHLLLYISQLLLRLFDPMREVVHRQRRLGLVRHTARSSLFYARLVFVRLAPFLKKQTLIRVWLMLQYKRKV